MAKTTTIITTSRASATTPWFRFTSPEAAALHKAFVAKRAAHPGFISIALKTESTNKLFEVYELTWASKAARAAFKFESDPYIVQMNAYNLANQIVVTEV